MSHGALLHSKQDRLMELRKPSVPVTGPHVLALVICMTTCAFVRGETDSEWRISLICTGYPFLLYIPSTYRLQGHPVKRIKLSMVTQQRSFCLLVTNQWKSGSFPNACNLWFYPITWDFGSALRASREQQGCHYCYTVRGGSFSKGQHTYRRTDLHILRVTGCAPNVIKPPYVLLSLHAECFSYDQPRDGSFSDHKWNTCRHL